MNIQKRVEGKRGCGYRKPGGMYLVGPREGKPCGLLPIPMIRCPYCDHGIKPARGWTWISIELFKDRTCVDPECKKKCSPFDGSVDKAGLIWVGGKYYKTPKDFTKEADAMGVSRRITAIPKGFVLGETWVLLAHREAIPNQEGEGHIPAIFTAFKPTAVEYVIKGTESFKDLESMEKRGITLVNVIKDEKKLFENTPIINQN